MADEPEKEDSVVVEDETKPEIAVEDGIEELKAKLAAERARADAAERTAAAAIGQVDQAQDEVTRSQLSVVNGAIEQLTTAKEHLKAEYADAMASGDFARAAEINSTMADNAAKLFNLENGKIALETAPKREARRAAETSGDPVERAISTWKLSPASAAWVRKHPEYATDPRKTQRMLAAHNMVVTEDNAPELESPEYFAAIEKNLGIGYSDAGRETRQSATTQAAEPLSAAAAPARRRDAAPPAAPASRSSGNSRTRTLTPTQAEAARISGVSNEEYARQLDKLARDKAH